MGGCDDRNDADTATAGVAVDYEHGQVALDGDRKGGRMKRTKISRYVVVGKNADTTDLEHSYGPYHKTKQQARDFRDGLNWQRGAFPDKPYRVVRLNIEIIEVDEADA